MFIYGTTVPANNRQSATTKKKQSLSHKMSTLCDSWATLYRFFIFVFLFAFKLHHLKLKKNYIRNTRMDLFMCTTLHRFFFGYVVYILYCGTETLYFCWVTYWIRVKFGGSFSFFKLFAVRMTITSFPVFYIFKRHCQYFIAHSFYNFLPKTIFITQRYRAGHIRVWGSHR